MHASQRLRESHFSVQMNGHEVSVDALLPQWTGTDRIGVVVHEPFGALGASLLIQAGISRFYSFDPERRNHRAQYPPIFMFHVGGCHGDHSPMDFWPARREIFLPNDPYEVLGAIRDRGITRLLVPEAANTGLDYAYRAPSGWTDIHSAQEQTASTFVYSPSGHLNEHNIEVGADNEQVEEMVTDVLESEALIELFKRSSDQDLLDLELGPSTPADLHGWLQSYITRTDEVSPSVRQRIRTNRQRQVTQTYRSVPLEEALGQLVPTGSRLSSGPVAPG